MDYSLEQVELKIKEVHENLILSDNLNTIKHLRERLHYLREKRVEIILNSSDDEITNGK